jgi:hypothetical protein
MADTLQEAFNKLTPDEMKEFAREYHKKPKEEKEMDEQEVWNEIQESVKQLNHYMRIAVAKGLRVEAEVDMNLFEASMKNPIPVVKVAVYKEMKDPRHTYAT